MDTAVARPIQNPALPAAAECLQDIADKGHDRRLVDRGDRDMQAGRQSIAAQGNVAGDLVDHGLGYTGKTARSVTAS